MSYGHYRCPVGLVKMNSRSFVTFFPIPSYLLPLHNLAILPLRCPCAFIRRGTSPLGTLSVLRCSLPVDIVSTRSPPPICRAELRRLVLVVADRATSAQKPMTPGAKEQPCQPDDRPSAGSRAASPTAVPGSTLPTGPQTCRLASVAFFSRCHSIPHALRESYSIETPEDHR